MSKRIGVVLASLAVLTAAVFVIWTIPCLTFLGLSILFGTELVPSFSTVFAFWLLYGLYFVLTWWRWS